PTERAEPPVATALKRAEQAASPGALQSCAPVDALMDNLEALPPARRSSSLREGLVDAWIQCDCEADLEAFLAAKIWPMAQRQPVSVGAIPMARLQKMTSENQDAWSNFESALRSM